MSTPLKHTQSVIKQAETQGFTKKILSTNSFELTSFYKIKNKDEPLTIYLEGDGHSIKPSGQPSLDPTPHQPLAFELALLDPRPNVIYIARPCQYSGKQNLKNCDQKYWSTHKFSKEVIESTRQGIEVYLAMNQNQKVDLIGFSGGGGLAVLLVAHDNRIQSLTTVAGDLDLKAMQAYHQTSPLIGSLEPKDFAPQVKHIPQQHWVGGRDRVVPPHIAQDFVNLQNQTCAKAHVIPKVEHHKGWKDLWTSLLQQKATCDS